MQRLLANLTAAHGWLVDNPAIVIPTLCTVLAVCCFAAAVILSEGAR